MPVAKSFAISLLGLAGKIIEIEAEISSNLPNFVLVGLPDASLSEAKDRVRSAAANTGLPLPGRRVTVNLTPAAVPKQGSSFDLAIAVAVLAADSRVNPESVASWVHIGELGLDGGVRPVPGILPALLAARAAGFNRAIVPLKNLAEARLVEGLEVVAVAHLSQVANLHGAEVDVPKLYQELEPEAATQQNLAAVPLLDMADVLGQNDAINALTVAAAGGHHVLMVGPPGSGKTMLAERLPSILPDLGVDEALETTAIFSVGQRSVFGEGLVTVPPFEAPHHTASVSSLIGGGLGVPRPGLVSFANHGVLFLDEAAEFSQAMLESLRQPLESGQVVINRSAGSARFPARFQLVLAANPCPCGHAFDSNGKCHCTATQRMRYAAKLSGPLLDRIDIRLVVRPANRAQLAIARNEAGSSAISSQQIQQNVIVARQRAAARLSGTPWTKNAQVPGVFLRKQLKLGKGVSALLDRALDAGKISMRGYDRCLRIAWTCADLAGNETPTADDLALAVYLRGPENPMASS